MEKLAQHAMQSEEGEDVEKLTEKLDDIHVSQSSDNQESDSDDCESDTDSVTTDSDEVTSENDDADRPKIVVVANIAENKNGVVIRDTDERMENDYLTAKDSVTKASDQVIGSDIVTNPDVFKNGVNETRVKTVVECDGMGQEIGAKESCNVAADCDGDCVVVKSASQSVPENECVRHNLDGIDSETRTFNQLERCIGGINIIENSGENERNSRKQSRPVMVEEIESST